MAVCSALSSWIHAARYQPDAFPILGHRYLTIFNSHLDCSSFLPTTSAQNSTPSLVLSSECGSGSGYRYRVRLRHVPSRKQAQQFRTSFPANRRGLAGIFADVVDHDCFPAGGCSSTNSLIERDARVWGHGAHKSQEHRRRRSGPWLEHTENPNPDCCSYGHPTAPTPCMRTFADGTASADELANLFYSDGDGHEQNLNSE